MCPVYQHYSWGRDLPSDTFIDYDYRRVEKIASLFQFPGFHSHNSKKPGLQQAVLYGLDHLILIEHEVGLKDPHQLLTTSEGIQHTNFLQKFQLFRFKDFYIGAFVNVLLTGLNWAGFSWKCVTSRPSVHQSGFSILIRLGWGLWGCLPLLAGRCQSNLTEQHTQRSEEADVIFLKGKLFINNN